jgi:hypothetical protein
MDIANRHISALAPGFGMYGGATFDRLDLARVRIGIPLVTSRRSSTSL